MSNSSATVVKSAATTSRRGMVVKAAPEHRVQQGSDYRAGVSAETTGSQVIWLGLMALPPGGRTKAHVHEHHETALYMTSGDALELWTGDELEHCEAVRPGDFVYIPANVLHVAVNRGATTAVFIGSRNEATARESMVLRPEMDARVP
ncbi:cupin domain-containing protein [Bradyrhizobium sp. KBS0727]|nr:cupin domain-containing protein [Bradyrhizobium sp. KBS0725]QDW44317.1 cupin domain-containing protein [Bradyrhizobium sp. KBS0727]